MRGSGWARAIWIWGFVLVSICAAYGQGSKKTSEFDAIEERDRDNPRAREQWFMRGRTAPSGEAAATLRLRAYEQKMQMRRQQFAARAVTAVPHLFAGWGWSPLGPAPLASDPGMGQNYGAVSGRATAVAIDPADATGNTVYIGGANGGVWKSTNGGATDPTTVVWTPVLDYESTLAVGAIAIQPGNSDPSRSVILVGTGEPNSSADSYYGLGILRSADGGATWSLISSDTTTTHSFAGLGFSKIAFSTSNPQLVVAAAAAAAEGVALGLENPVTVNRGIYYSQDAGQTWHYASIKDGSTTVSPGSVTSVAYNAVAGKFFAAVRYHGIYSSSDGINWTRLADAAQPGSGLNTANCPAITSTTCPIYRAEIGVVSGRNEMYTWVVALDSTGLEVDGGLWQSLNGGTAAWTSIADGGITNCGDPGLGGCGVQQGSYNLEIAALPDGSGTDLYAGAINIYKCRITTPSSPGSCSFLNLTHVYGCLSIANVHPDQHHLAGVIAGGKQLMYFVNDGGVYRALDGYTGLMNGSCGGAQNAFDDLNGTLGSMTQFVSFSMHPSDANTFLGGTQDNGSPATGTATTSTSWANVRGGDGGFNAISPTTPTNWFTANPDLPPNSLNINYCSSGIACTNNAFQQVVTSAQVGGDDGAFYFPYILDPQASSQLIVGSCRVWRGGPATSSAGTYTALSNNFDTGVGGSGGICNGSEVNLVRSLAAGGPKDSNGSKVIYAGTNASGGATNPPGGRVFVTTNAGSSVMVDRTGTINPGEFPVSSIAIDPSDATGQTAYVTIMGFHVGHVFKTTNAGVTWTDFSGTSPNNIPDAPADAVVVDASAGMVYVGTDVGVFVSSTSTASWTELGPAATVTGAGYLPNVPVTALGMFNSGGKKLLRASTYGRGVWQYSLLPDFQISISNSIQTIFAGQTAVFNGNLKSANGYASLVTISCTAGSTPPPSTCNPNPTSLTPTGTPFSLTAADVIGDYFFNVHGEGTDPLTVTHDEPMVLQVVDLGAPSPANVAVEQGSTSAGVSFLVSGDTSFRGTITLSCPASGMPAGVSCVFSPSVSISALPAMVTLTFIAQASAKVGTTTISVSASTQGAPSPKTQDVSLTVTPPIPDYRITISNSTQSAPANQSAAFNGVLQGVNGYNSTVSLSCGGPNPPPTCTIAPASVSPGQTFTVTTSSSIAKGYSFSVNGTGTDVGHTLHSTPALTFNSLFTVSLSDNIGTQSVKAGQTATYSLVAVPVGSSVFATAVTFTCSGLPSGATCSVAPIPAQANGAQSVTVAIATSGAAHNALRSRLKTTRRNGLLLILASITGMLVGGLRSRPMTTRKAFKVVALAVAIISIFSIPSCGGGGASPSAPGSLIAVSINPPTASPYPFDHQQFTASVTGTNNTQVQWQVNGVDGGSATAGLIDKTGMYTAPGVVPSSPTVSVSAVSLADVSKFATAYVTVQAPAIFVTPPTSFLYPSQQQQFNATVHGLSSAQISWQVNGVSGGNSTFGTIDAAGLYTAPALVPSPSTIAIEAVSVADVTIVGSAEVTVQSPGILINPKTASLYPSQQQQFTVSGNGPVAPQVTWQVNGATGGSPAAGTIDSTGLYTAPSVVPTPNVPAMVSAISQADVTKSDTATVTIKAPTPSGTYTVTITATVGSLTQSTTATLVVE